MDTIIHQLHGIGEEVEELKGMVAGLATYEKVQAGQELARDRGEGELIGSLGAAVGDLKRVLRRLDVASNLSFWIELFSALRSPMLAMFLLVTLKRGSTGMRVLGIFLGLLLDPVTTFAMVGGSGILKACRILVRWIPGLQRVFCCGAAPAAPAADLEMAPAADQGPAPGDAQGFISRILSMVIG